MGQFNVGIHSDTGERAGSSGSNGLWLGMGCARENSSWPREGNDNGIEGPNQFVGGEVSRSEMKRNWFESLRLRVSKNAREVESLKKRVEHIENTILRDAVKKMSDNLK